MDLTSIIVAIIGGIVSTVCAYLAIVPQIKKSKIETKDIEDAINNSDAIKAMKDGLVSEMRKSLISQYWEYSDRGFDMSQTEIDDWNDDIKKYHKLGGNGTITEMDNSLQFSLMERERAKNDQRVRKL